MPLIAFIDEIPQHFAGVMGIVSINRNTAAVIDILLQNFPRKTGAQDKKILCNLCFINDDVVCTRLVFCAHKQLQRRLGSCYNDAAAKKDRAGGIVLLTVFNCILPLPFSAPAPPGRG